MAIESFTKPDSDYKLIDDIMMGCFLKEPILFIRELQELWIKNSISVSSVNLCFSSVRNAFNMINNHKEIHTFFDLFDESNNSNLKEQDTDDPFKDYHGKICKLNSNKTRGKEYIDRIQ